jgi:alkanesulfonate monooxygenase SsuD/methylene tetrahydromethanopterin reductase-like flavin-dependent oxidoreductase (luciferase family)
MVRFYIRFDLRAPSFGTPRPQLYSAAVAMSEFADKCGFYAVRLSEHHGVADGYLSSGAVFGAAIAARTQKLGIELYAIVAGLHDPLRLAEDLAVLDNLSGGRLSVAIGAGYVPAEYHLFGKDMRKRVTLLEKAVATLKAAWTGRPFEYEGRTVLVTPPCLQQPRPRIVVAGNVPAAAERAGRIADGFLTMDKELHAIYRASALKAGKEPDPYRAAGPHCLFVSENPEETWEAILPHVLHEINDYGKWAVDAGLTTGYSPATSIEEVKKSGYAVVTPAECIEMAKTDDDLLFHPLVGGLDPAVGWASLNLVASEVLPALR